MQLNSPSLVDMINCYPVLRKSTGRLFLQKQSMSTEFLLQTALPSTGKQCLQCSVKEWPGVGAHTGGAGRPDNKSACSSPLEADCTTCLAVWLFGCSFSYKNFTWAAGFPGQCGAAQGHPETFTTGLQPH